MPVIEEIPPSGVLNVVQMGERFDSMSKPAAKPGSVKYGEQELKLSKVFRDLEPSAWRARKG